MSHSFDAISTWPHDDRPREKLIHKGEQVLSNAELLAILLRTGYRGCSALDLARQVLGKHTTFRSLSSLSFDQWTDVKGMGPAKVSQIKAALEIGRRFREENLKEKRLKITSAKDVISMLMPRMRDCVKEVFYVLYLNAAHELIECVQETQGTVNQAFPIIREIFHKALLKECTAILCAHNHPAGNVTPSLSDKKFTEKLVASGKILQIKVLDHVIVGDNQYYSFAEEGLI